MALDAATIRIAITTDATQSLGAVAAHRAAMTGWERSVTKSLASVKRAYSGLSTGQKALGAAAIGVGAVAVAFRAVVGPAIEFESAFAGVRKTVDGSTSQLASIRQGLLDMSAVMPTTASELAGIAENAGQLGVAAPAVLEFTRSIAMLGETTDLDFDQAAQSLARFLNITGDGAEGIGEVADVIVELGNNSATTESQIVDFSTRLASAFTTAGATSDEILAVAAAFSSMGLRAEAGGSALSRIITSISDAAIDGGKELEVYAETAGILPEQFREIARTSPVEALLLVGEGLGRIQEAGGSITPILEDVELGGLRTSEVFRLLALNSDSVRDSLGLAADQMENGGAAAEEYGKRVETTASRLAILQNRLNTLAIELGTPALDSVALAADTTGDAIEGLVDILRPVGLQVRDLFTNMAGSVEILYDALGAPALGFAVAGLTGLASVAEGLLTVLNALGPVGLIIAALVADIALVGPVTTAAVIAIDALAASFFAAGTGGLAAAAGTAAFQAALTIGPIVAIAGVLAALGKSLIDADRAARQAATGFRDEFVDAIESADFDRTIESISEVEQRIEELRKVDRVPDGVATSWDGWGQSIKSVGQILTPFTENTIVNARAEANALADELDQVGTTSDLFGRRIAGLAAITGISRGETTRLAAEMGILRDVTAGNVIEQTAATVSFIANTQSQRELADATGIAIERILNQTATIGDFGRAMEITGDQVAFLTTKIDNVDVADFADPDKMDAAFDAVNSLVGAYSALAEQAGMTTGSFIDQLKSVNDLAASHNRLQTAVQGALDALSLLEAQEAAVTTATETFDTALAGIDGSIGSIEGASTAMRELIANYAASGATLPDVIAKQAELRDSLINAAVAAGHSRDEAALLVTTLGLIPPAVLAEIVLEGTQAKADADEVQRQLLDLAGIYDVLLAVEDDEARADILATRATAEAWADADYLAELNVESPQALAEIQERHEQARAFADALYMAELEADGDPARVETDATGAHQRAMAAQEYESTLTADGSQAIDVANQVARAIRGVPTIWSTSIITYYRDVGRPSGPRVRVSTGRNRFAEADGGIRFGADSYMNDGGMAAPMLSGVPDRRQDAQIYGPRMPFRVFYGEPETEGEAYIPLAASKRNRSIGIWEETGRLLGVMANGAISGAAGRPSLDTRAGPGLISLAANVAINVEASPGLDAEAIGQIAERRVSAALATQAARLDQRRILV